MKCLFATATISSNPVSRFDVAISLNILKIGIYLGSLFPYLCHYLLCILMHNRQTDSPTGGGSGSVRFEPHMDQSQPSRREEEDIQLQLALRMSKEQAEEEDKIR